MTLKDGSQTTLASYNYDYSSLGKITTITDNLSNTYNFTYNDAGRLTHEDKKDSQNNVIFSRDYAYDYAGNRTSETRDAASIAYTYNDANQLASRVISGGETISYTYDNNGSLTQQVSSLNGTTNYGFDLENRLVSAVTPSSSSYYGYSGDGRRTYSYIDNNEVEYIYDGLTPLIERSGPGTYIAAYTRLPSAPGGIGGLISSYDGTNTLYYHDSNLGNLNQITDSTGTVIQTYDYDAFGSITSQSGALTAKYAYKTKEYSPETGLIFFGARYYNPLIGRFITKDPSGMVDGPNVYLYCKNDAINKVDPTGKQTYDIQMVGPIVDKIWPTISMWTTNAMNWAATNAQFISDWWTVITSVPDVYERQKAGLEEEDASPASNNGTQGDKSPFSIFHLWGYVEGCNGKNNNFVYRYPEFMCPVPYKLIPYNK